jgi:hypothetical protein
VIGAAPIRIELNGARPPLGLEPKSPPAHARWEEQAPWLHDGMAARVWQRGRIRVLSTLALFEFRGQPRWQWHVSVSSAGHRPTDDQVDRALRDFKMAFAEEDNHSPGVARHFFLGCFPTPEEVATGTQCECKETEEVVVEPDGYTWSRERGEAKP